MGGASESGRRATEGKVPLGYTPILSFPFSLSLTLSRSCNRCTPLFPFFSLFLVGDVHEAVDVLNSSRISSFDIDPESLCVYYNIRLFALTPCFHCHYPPPLLLVPSLARTIVLSSLILPFSVSLSLTHSFLLLSIFLSVSSILLPFPSYLVLLVLRRRCLRPLRCHH